MAKIPSWQDLGRAFEELDEHGYLCLLWKYVPELKQHSFWFEWNSAARFHDRNKYSKAERDLITAKFRAISKTAGIKRGFADPATGWLAVIRAISGNDLLGTGIATDIDTGTAYSAISGRVPKRGPPDDGVGPHGCPHGQSFTLRQPSSQFDGCRWVNPLPEPPQPGHFYTTFPPEISQREVMEIGVERIILSPRPLRIS